MVRGIDADIELSRLSDVAVIGSSPFGPVWSAVLDGDTRVRAFGLRSDSDHDRDSFVESLVDTLRVQVVLSHATLARPVGVVNAMRDLSSEDDSEWAALLYRCDATFTSADLEVAANTLLMAARFLDVVVTAERRSCWRGGTLDVHRQRYGDCLLGTGRRRRRPVDRSRIAVRSAGAENRRHSADVGSDGGVCGGNLGS